MLCGIFACCLFGICLLLRSSHNPFCNFRPLSLLSLRLLDGPPCSLLRSYFLPLRRFRLCSLTYNRFPLSNSPCSSLLRSCFPRNDLKRLPLCSLPCSRLNSFSPRNFPQS